MHFLGHRVISTGALGKWTISCKNCMSNKVNIVGGAIKVYFDNPSLLSFSFFPNLETPGLARCQACSTLQFDIKSSLAYKGQHL